MKKLHEVKRVEKTESDQEIYIINYSRRGEDIGIIEYRRRNEMLYLREIYVFPHVRNQHWGKNILHQFLSSLNEPISAKLVSEESIHLFYNMKKHYPTIIRNMQISYEKCVCHYCKNEIKFLDQLEITDLYYKHLKGKCPSYQKESLPLGLYTGSERMKENRSRIYNRSHCDEHPSDRRTRRQKNQYYKKLYDDIDSIKRQKEREVKQWKNKREETRNPHFIQKKRQVKKITAEEYAELYLQQLGY